MVDKQASGSEGRAPGLGWREGVAGKGGRSEGRAVYFITAAWSPPRYGL